MDKCINHRMTFFLFVFVFESFFKYGFFYRQRQLKLVSSDTVFHALSHDVLFNDFWFSFRFITSTFFEVFISLAVFGLQLAFRAMTS